METKAFPGTTPKNETLVSTAIKNNCWICMRKDWYTPAEFLSKFGPTHLIYRDLITIRNPLAAISEGCKAVDSMINAGRNIKDIQVAATRLKLFVDKVAAMDYHPIPGQLDRVPLPDDLIF